MPVNNWLLNNGALGLWKRTSLQQEERCQPCAARVMDERSGTRGAARSLPTTAPPKSIPAPAALPLLQGEAGWAGMTVAEVTGQK